MPEYLAPGVYVEETSYRSRSIEGVSTSTAGFVGRTRTGPASGRPEVLTSFADFTRTYGGAEPLGDGPNYLAHAARAFFEEGGARLYVQRVARGATRAAAGRGPLTLTAREAGSGGASRVTFTLAVGADVRTPTNPPALTRVRNQASVLAVRADGSAAVATAARDLAGTWRLVAADGTASGLDRVVAVHPLTVAVEVEPPTLDAQGLAAFGPPTRYGPMSLAPGAPDGLWHAFGPDGDAPVVLGAGGAPAVDTLTRALFGAASPIGSPIGSPVEGWPPAGGQSPLAAPRAPGPVAVVLAGGGDGVEPTAADYAGDAEALTGLGAFEALEDVSIVAAPGSTELGEAAAIRQAVIGHCERMRYRVAVLDVPRSRGVGGAQDWRNETSTKYGALYYPWVTVPDPFLGGELALPPSGFVAGIWARNDRARAVFKAPANEVVRSATGLERRLTTGQQEVLNPDGVNCLRFFPGRGNLVWGARTMSDDPEWTYVSVRRYFAYLEHSIDRSTQWITFEPNGEALWANVRRTVEDFLVSEWKSGALLGADARSAFFVRCDRSTMTQNDLDNGRLVCRIGVAVVKPAEFVIFRIGQWTASATA